ncbi:hypothetical protein KI387_004164, partial [Taxus chinensis]
MGSYESMKKTESIRARRRHCCKMVLLLLVLFACSGLLTFTVFRGHEYDNALSLLRFSATTTSTSEFEELLRKFNITQRNLLATQAELQNLKAELLALTTPAQDDLPRELKETSAGHKLPLGRSRVFNSDTIYAPMGHPCIMMEEELRKYMDYRVGRQCPDDDILAQTLMLRGCEPLPRRRCFPPAPANYTEPFPFPKSTWSTPADSSIVWTPYTCKSYGCLIERKNQKGVWSDCKDCFDLAYREKYRWLNSTNPLHFGIDQVLELKKGTIRIGLDIGGGTATFAVRMRERNVTIVTTSMNLDGPFNNFIASRGMVPMFLTISQRLPFFDNTLDLIHSMHVLSNWIPTTLLDFVLYDIYRVLRPGGIFWLDHFFCVESQLDVYVPMIESFGYNKIKWVVGRKLDKGAQFKEIAHHWYQSRSREERRLVLREEGEKLPVPMWRRLVPCEEGARSACLVPFYFASPFLRRECVTRREDCPFVLCVALKVLECLFAVRALYV